MNSGLEFCIYITPCGYCSKFDKWCEKKKNKYNKSKGETIDEEEFKNLKLNGRYFNDN